MKGLRLEMLRELISTGSVRDVVLVAQGRKWSVLVRTGLAERTLLTDRGRIREFGKLETVVSLIRDAGLGRFAIDATHYDRNQRTLDISRGRDLGARSDLHP